MSVSSIQDAELVRRAVANARANTKKGLKHPRWVGVMEVFSLGSGYARELCMRFGLDPDDLVKRD